MRLPTSCLSNAPYLPTCERVACCFQATAGWDAATGLGTPLWPGLYASAMAAGRGGGPDEAAVQEA